MLHLVEMNKNSSSTCWYSLLLRAGETQSRVAAEDEGWMG